MTCRTCVEKAVKEAADQNSPLFGWSALTLDNPWLWVTVAATVTVFFVAEDVRTDTKVRALRCRKGRVGRTRRSCSWTRRGHTNSPRRASRQHTTGEDTERVREEKLRKSLAAYREKRRDNS